MREMRERGGEERSLDWSWRRGHGSDERAGEQSWKRRGRSWRGGWRLELQTSGRQASRKQLSWHCVFISWLQADKAYKTFGQARTHTPKHTQTEADCANVQTQREWKNTREGNLSHKLNYTQHTKRTVCHADTLAKRWQGDTLHKAHPPTLDW